MNERYGRDYDDDNDAREDWDDRSERGRSQRDFSRGERDRPNWGGGRSWNQSSGERGGNPESNRSQSGVGARYGHPQYDRGMPYSGEYGGSGYGGSNYGAGSVSGGGRGYGSYGAGGSSSGSYGAGGYSGGERGASSGYRGQYGQSEQYPRRYEGGSSGRPWDSGRREESWGNRNDVFEYRSSYGSQGSGGFFGKGPKGYTRSDERIREDVCDRLSDDDEVDASDIAVTVKDGEVTLDGTVPDRRSKHRAEDLAEAVSGVKDVHNSLRPQKGILQEIGDRVTGRADAEQHGHFGSGTRNSGGTTGTATSTSTANRT
jgi:hypothetical protein